MVAMKKMIGTNRDVRVMVRVSRYVGKEKNMEKNENIHPAYGRSRE